MSLKEVSCAASSNLLGGKVRTNLAHPLWYKSLKNNELETYYTSENEHHLGRCFFANDSQPGRRTGLFCVLLIKPNLTIGFNNVLTQRQQPQPNRMIGFFNDNTMNPAAAGFINVQNKYKHENPEKFRVFCCTEPNS